MAAMPKHWSDLGHSSSYSGMSVITVFILCSWGRHITVNLTMVRGSTLSSLRFFTLHTQEFTWVSCVWKTELFNNDELGNFSAGLIRLTAGTLIANDSMNKSQRFHCKSEISSSVLNEKNHNAGASLVTVFILQIIWVAMSLLEIKQTDSRAQWREID